MFYYTSIYSNFLFTITKIENKQRSTYTSLKFFNLVIVHTLDFWYMIKINKQPTAQHWNFAIFWINSQPNWTNVWASKSFVWNEASERVFVGNWADQRFVQNVSKIPPLCCRLLIYFLSYTQNLQLAITKFKISLWIAQRVSYPIQISPHP